MKKNQLPFLPLSPSTFREEVLYAEKYEDELLIHKHFLVLTIISIRSLKSREIEA